MLRWTGPIQRAGARASGGGGAFLNALREGAPRTTVAALAALVLVAILFTVATREPEEPRGYAELTMYPQGCAVDPRTRLNAASCAVLGPGTYEVRFTKALSRAPAVATRGSCCPGPIAASVATDRTVLVVVGRRPRRPVRASVFVP